MKTRLTLLSIICIICFSCANQNKDDNSTKQDNLSFQDTTIQHSVVGEPLQSQESPYVLTNRKADSLILKIRNYFDKTNKISKWTKIQKEFLEGTNEGGEAKFFFLNNQLKKITTDQMGETFRLVREYYLDNSKLIFVFESFEKYHMPFDRSNSKFFESRKYFNDEKIFKRINSKSSENPLDEILVTDDQIEILTELKNLKKLQQTKL